MPRASSGLELPANTSIWPSSGRPASVSTRRSSRDSPPEELPSPSPALTDVRIQPFAAPANASTPTAAATSTGGPDLEVPRPAPLCSVLPEARHVERSPKRARRPRSAAWRASIRVWASRRIQFLSRVVQSAGSRVRAVAKNYGLMGAGLGACTREGEGACTRRDCSRPPRRCGRIDTEGSMCARAAAAGREGPPALSPLPPSGRLSLFSPFPVLRAAARLLLCVLVVQVLHVATEHLGPALGLDQVHCAPTTTTTNSGQLLPSPASPARNTRTAALPAGVGVAVGGMVDGALAQVNRLLVAHVVAVGAVQDAVGVYGAGSHGEPRHSGLRTQPGSLAVHVVQCGALGREQAPAGVSTRRQRRAGRSQALHASAPSCPSRRSWCPMGARRRGGRGREVRRVEIALRAQAFAARREPGPGRSPCSCKACSGAACWPPRRRCAPGSGARAGWRQVFVRRAGPWRG